MAKKRSEARYAQDLEEAAVRFADAAQFAARGDFAMAAESLRCAALSVRENRPSSGDLSDVADVAEAQCARLEASGPAGKGFAKSAAGLARFLMERSTRAR